MSAKAKLPLTLTGIVKREGDQYAALCLEFMRDTGREDEVLRPVPVEALREFLTETYYFNAWCELLRTCGEGQEVVE